MWTITNKARLFKESEEGKNVTCEAVASRSSKSKRGNHVQTQGISGQLGSFAAFLQNPERWGSNLAIRGGEWAGEGEQSGFCKDRTKFSLLEPSEGWARPLQRVTEVKGRGRSAQWSSVQAQGQPTTKSAFARHPQALPLSWE